MKNQMNNQMKNQVKNQMKNLRLKIKKIETTDMSELESKESEAKRINQQEQGLKILTLN